MKRNIFKNQKSLIEKLFIVYMMTYLPDILAYYDIIIDTDYFILVSQFYFWNVTCDVEC